MIGADSNYLVDGILRDARLIGNEVLVTPDLALYEVISTLWKHETIIGDLDDSSYIGLMLELVSAGAILLVRPDRKPLNEIYALSVKHRMPVYDTVFVALALQLALELKTCDGKQAKLLSKERGEQRLGVL
jgi:predicted nucleic acid-binding protein